MTHCHGQGLDDEEDCSEKTPVNVCMEVSDDRTMINNTSANAQDIDEQTRGDTEPAVRADPPSRYSLQYYVADNPPPHFAFLFGLQQVLLSISSTISIPLIVATEICAGDLDLVKSKIMSTFLFMCGLTTLLQTTLGVRLPVIQGGCHKFIPAVMALMALPVWKCPDMTSHDHVIENVTYNSTNMSQTETWDARTEIWQSRMREIQGGIMVSAMVQVFVGCTGVLGVILHYIGPITIIPTITLVGLSLTDVALRFCQVHWGVSSLTVFLVFLFSLYMSEIHVPLPSYNKQHRCHFNSYPIFKLLPVILAVLLSWAVCAILTITNAVPQDSSSPQYFTRTDARTYVLKSASWFYFPYPGQWGLPTISVASFMAMLAATFTSIIESVGDYYACARISCAPPPPAHAVNRGIAMEGFGSILSGLVGSGGATTSYSQNVGAIGFTKVASRRAFQAAGLIFLLCGICGKFGALLTLLPDPVLGGIVLVSFGMVASVGLSNLQFVDLQSSRNLVIIGSSLIIGLMLPKYVTGNPGCVQTGNAEFDRVLTVLMSTAMFVGGVIGFVLDNTVPGTDEERGIKAWRKQLGTGEATHGTDTTYDLPYITSWLRKRRWATYIPFLPTFETRSCRITSRCRDRKRGARNCPR